MPTNMPLELLPQAIVDANDQGYRLEIIDGTVGSVGITGRPASNVTGVPSTSR